MGRILSNRSGLTKNVYVIVFLKACFIFSLAIGAFAQEIQKNDLSVALKQEPTKKQDSTEFMTGQSKDFWDSLALLNSNASTERPEEGNRIRTFSLYPQSFSAAKPEALQTTPARSYLFSLNDGSKDAFFGLANVASEEKMELKNLNQTGLDTELLVGYQWGGFGSILFGRALQVETQGENGGRVSDQGWRIKFMRNF